MSWPPPQSIFTAGFPFSMQKGKFACKDRHFYTIWPLPRVSLQFKDGQLILPENLMLSLSKLGLFRLKNKEGWISKKVKIHFKATTPCK